MRSLVMFGALVLAVLLISPATAVVNQVDGLVVPVQEPSSGGCWPSYVCPGWSDRCPQTGLNFGENPGQDPRIPSQIDAVLDAKTTPETFLVPRTAGGQFRKVNFWLVQEGAGYENIFGWYNVGSPDLRFPAIFSCRDGNRSLYEPPQYTTASCATRVPGANEGYKVEIDFELEFQAGRYLGGQIGFYLIAPEGSINTQSSTPSARRNCATDPDDQGVLDYDTMVVTAPIDDDNFDETGGSGGVDDLNGFGRIYYTESALNNDGNYVHYLVYQGKVDPEHFYFAFEDLFRGGDNDFDDTLVKVEGLSIGCIPAQEVCNGIDDNCNGLIDEDLTRPCGNQFCPGVETCTMGVWGGCSARTPTPEVCNGLDDNCNGLIDDGVTGGACTLAGCVGQEVCVNGAMVCDAPPPSPEICDGIDNDCNGLIDDGVTRPCMTACGIGVETCQFVDDGDPETNWGNCSAPLPSPEICDGIDNDCNGVIDDGIPPGPECSIGPCTGNLVCQGGVWVCNAQPPSPEICDGKDNNCNGLIDENLTRPCMTVCGFGVETCEFVDDGDPETNWVGCTARLPEPEVCDGVDNDCNGIIDDDVPGEDEPCDHPSGMTCKQGRTRCVGGKIVCIGATTGTEEICDCKDNNCNGLIDEGNPCPPGTECIECGCRVPCSASEFGCPSGFVCKNSYCIPDKCVGVKCAPDEQCLDGLCIDPCAGVKCGEAEVCLAGRCVADNCYGKGCPEGEVCVDNRCQPDPCRSLICDRGQYCQAGECKPSCGFVVCGSRRCVDGRCVDNPCAGVVCNAGIDCVDGECDDACEGVLCSAAQRCRAGRCVDDPCALVRCYDPNERCVAGQCVSEVTYAERRDVLAAGAGGLACSLAPGSGAGNWPPIGLLLVVGLAALLGRRRRDRAAVRRSGRTRTRRRGLLAGLAALLVALSGCDHDPLGVLTSDVVWIEGDASTCVPTGEEICDGIDNNCDGRIDEGFNLLLDPENCGECGNSCLLPGALTICELGECKFLGCAPGFVDLNEDPTDGCEYECTPTGEEVCDGKDNDCNGEIDEIFDLQSDVEHCGACDSPCRLANAVPRCEQGQCRIHGCEPGYIDADGLDHNGCEQPCTITNNGVEICDGKDNDCNGVIDDPGGVPIDFDTDPLHCGGCNVPCVLPNAVTECKAGKCQLIGCSGDYVDADGDPSNGCECLPEGPEVCDGKDNDCNGLIDDNLPPLGACGTDTGECQSGELWCLAGLWTCVGAIGPQPEVCDGKDNDCNGLIDDNLPPLGTCGSSVGTCRAGTLQCQNGAPACVGAVGPTTEVCDGLDNDCDGVVDNNISAVGAACGTSVGECVAGTVQCIAGQLQCVGQVGPTVEHCDDGKDTDCDGSIDPQACVYAATGREVRLDQPASACGASNSAQLAVAGKDQLVAAVWVDRRSGHSQIYGSLSLDGGGGWLPEQPIADEGSNNKIEPAVAFGGGTGNQTRAYVAYAAFSGNQRDVYLRRTSDRGQTWSAPVLVEKRDTADYDALFVRLAVRPGASSDTVVVCWERIYRTGQIRPNLRCHVSTDSGATFTGDDVQVNATSDVAFVPELAIDDQNVYVVWQQEGDKVQLSWSALSAPLAFSGHERTLNTVAGRRPRVAVDGQGLVVVVWESLPASGLVDLHATRSSDHGATFLSAPVRVDNDAVDGDSLDPALAIRPGSPAQVYVAWADTCRGAANIYVNRSIDGGATYGLQSRKVNASETGKHAAARPQISVSLSSPGSVYVVWEDFRNGSGVHRDIYFGQSLDGGQTWNVPDYRIDESLPAGAADARSPFIWTSAVAGGDRVALVWLDNRTATTSAATGPNADIWASYVE